jgi:hypothetical protein
MSGITKQNAGILMEYQWKMNGKVSGKYHPTLCDVIFEGNSWNLRDFYSWNSGVHTRG